MRVARSRTRTISPAASLIVRRLAGDADEHLVAGGGVERLVFADEDFRLEDAVDRVGADKTVPGLRAAEDAGERATRIDRTKGVVAPSASRPMRRSSRTVLRNSEYCSSLRCSAA